MFNPSRNQARDFLFESWRKYGAQEILTPLESMAASLIAEHPEYHPLLTQRDQYVDRDYQPEHGETNPFLHISLHLAIREQISIDQPQGVRNAHQRLSQMLDSQHQAEHHMMDCLTEMIWQAQRQGTSPNPQIYLDGLAKKISAQLG